MATGPTEGEATGSTGGVATAASSRPPERPTTATPSDRLVLGNQETLPSLSSVIQSTGRVYGRGGAAQRDSAMTKQPSNMSPPARPSFASQPQDSSQTSRYDPVHLYAMNISRPPPTQHSFYSILDPPRPDREQVSSPQHSGGSFPTGRRYHEGSASPFWAPSSSNTLRPDAREPEHERELPASPSDSTSPSRKRQASKSDSPPSVSGSSLPKHRRTQPPPRAAVNAPSDAWVRPAPPRIRNTTQWTVERVNGYKEGYSDAMDAVKRGQMGWDGDTYCNFVFCFVFWRHSPAMVAAETQNDSGMEDDDISPYSEAPISEDRLPLGDSPWSPALMAPNQFHRMAPGSQASRYSQQQEQTRRQAISCWPCRKRKLKCDGQHPCGTCVRRPADQGCVYEQEIKRRGKGRKGQPEGSMAPEESEHMELRMN